jgi:hypothetical protein
MPEEVKRCRLAREPGEDSCSVLAFIERQARERPPRLVWVEPDPAAVAMGPGGGRRIAALPLAGGTPESWPDDWRELPLTEARLFWPTSALHVLAHDDGCRWVRIEERDRDAVEHEDREECDEDVVERVVSSAFAQSDASRYGLAPAAVQGPLISIQYRKRGRLVGWRLMEAKA